MPGKGCCCLHRRMACNRTEDAVTPLLDGDADAGGADGGE